MNYLNNSEEKKLLSLNVYYKPDSFGGATIVAEEVNNILSENFGWNVLVVTTQQNKDLPPYHLIRYNLKEVTVIAINLPNHIDYLHQYYNKEIAAAISNILDIFEPDVVHTHSIQTIGATFFRETYKRRIPTFLTLHDCWWICDRQFMINNSGHYCFQEKIDPNVCLYCVDNINKYDERRKYLLEILGTIDYYLFPSQFHRVLHIANGLPEDKCFVNKNGIKLPASNYARKESKHVRFGFAGGPGKIKGFELIKKVFESLEGDYHELVVVDGAKNLGKSWSNAFNQLKIKGKLTIAPPYQQNNMDDFFSQFDVLLFPSQWKESFGLTVREALVRDIWIISTNGGGTTEDLIEGENATIIPITNSYLPLLGAVKDCLNQDWNTYTNPHKKKITSYEQQAFELDAYFQKSLNLSVANEE